LRPAARGARAMAVALDTGGTARRGRADDASVQAAAMFAAPPRRVAIVGIPRAVLVWPVVTRIAPTRRFRIAPAAGIVIAPAGETRVDLAVGLPLRRTPLARPPRFGVAPVVPVACVEVVASASGARIGLVRTGRSMRRDALAGTRVVQLACHPLALGTVVPALGMLAAVSGVVRSGALHRCSPKVCGTDVRLDRAETRNRHAPFGDPG